MTQLYPQKFELTSPTGGGRSVGIVRSRTKATEFSLVLVDIQGQVEISDEGGDITLLSINWEEFIDKLDFFQLRISISKS